MEKNRISWKITLAKIFANKEKLRFILAGFINTFLGYLLFIIFNFLFYNYFIALLFVYFIGIFINYFTYKNIVFLNKNKSNLFRFILVYVIFLFLNAFFIKVGLIFIKSEILIQAFMLPFLALGLYYSLKKIVF